MKLNWKEILYIIYMVYVIYVPGSIFYTDNINRFAILLACYGGFTLIIYKKKIKKSFLDNLLVYIIPMAILTLVSIIGALFVHHTSNFSDVTQSIWRFILYCAAFFIAYSSYEWFKERSILLFVISGIVSYITVIVQYIVYGGFYVILHPFSGTIKGINLEVHNLTYCMGLCLIYYLLSTNYSKKYKRIICTILCVCVFWGNKRALYLALVVTLGIYYLLHKFDDKKVILLKTISVVYIIVAFVYLLLIKSGMFQAILLVLNVDDMSRLKFWNYFSNSYKLSPSYIGRGISYTDNIMASTEAMSNMRITSKTLIHNDILRAYIGWGFIPLLYYLVVFFVVRTRKLVKRNSRNFAWRYFAIASMTYFIYFFDNMLYAVEYNIAFCIIWFLLVAESSKESVTVEKSC